MTFVQGAFPENERCPCLSVYQRRRTEKIPMCHYGIMLSSNEGVNGKQQVDQSIQTNFQEKRTIRHIAVTIVKLLLGIAPCLCSIALFRFQIVFRFSVEGVISTWTIPMSLLGTWCGIWNLRFVHQLVEICTETMIIDLNTDERLKLLFEVLTF